MTFTDDDLKLLQAYINGDLELEIGPSELVSLLDRLEAAEVIAEDHASIYPNDPVVIRWRKAKGESK